MIRDASCLPGIPWESSSEIFWGHVETCTSTQDVARFLWDQGGMQACVVTADRQSAGRGTWGRTWWSHPGNLLLSITVARGSQEQSRSVERLPFQAATIVAEWLQSLGAQTSIRGVNDVILLAGPGQTCSHDSGAVAAAVAGKVCGLLVECWEGRREAALTLGLGLNCAYAPPWAEAQQATSSMRDHGMHLKPSQAANALVPRMLDLFGLKSVEPVSPIALKLEDPL